MKRALDICGATLGIVVFGPLMLLIAVAIVLDSGFPVLFRQRRIGQGERVFEILKFRTMHKGADSAWVQENDNRITRVGGILRRVSLDELPQFFNVLIGDMALVGPRPEMEAYSDEFARKIPSYRVRYLVKPGITGYAQMYGPRTYAPSQIEDVLKLDLWYVRNYTPQLDIALLFKTVTEFLFHQAL